MALTRARACGRQVRLNVALPWQAWPRKRTLSLSDPLTRCPETVPLTTAVAACLRSTKVPPNFEALIRIGGKLLSWSLTLEAPVHLSMIEY